MHTNNFHQPNTRGGAQDKLRRLSKIELQHLGLLVYPDDERRTASTNGRWATCPANTTALRDGVNDIVYVTSEPVQGRITALDFVGGTATIGGTPVTLSVFSVVTTDRLPLFASLVFDTVADATTVPNSKALTLKEGDFLSTLAHNADLTQWWQVVSGDPSPNFGLQIGATGLYIKEVSPIKYIESFGGYGDDVGDDSPAIAIAMASDVQDIHTLSTTYRTTANIAVGSKRLIGNGCTIRCDHTGQMFTVNGGEVSGITFDGDSNQHTTNATEILKGSNSKVKHCIIENVHGVSTFQTYGLFLPMFEAYNFEVSDTIIRNITQDDDGAVTGKGFCGAVYMNDSVLGTQGQTTYGKFHNVYSSNIYSVDAGSGVVQDSDMIRCFWDNVNGSIANLKWQITFDTITAVNVGKRVFKTGGLNGCTARNLNCIKNDAAPEDMYSVMSLTNGSSAWVIEGVRGEGEFARGLEMSGNDHVVSDVNLKSTAGTTGYGLQIGASFGICNDSTFDNVRLSGFDSAVYGYDCIDCTVSNGKFKDNALSVLTNNTSGDNSLVVNDTDCIGGPIQLAGGAFLELNRCKMRGIVPTATGYALNVLSGNLRVRGMLINADLSARRPVNLALDAANVADIDDLTVIRNTDASAVVNDHCIFTTQDAAAGAILRAGKIRVVSNVNPDIGGAAANGRELVLLKNINYNIDTLEVENNDARGSVSADIRATGGQGKCRVTNLRQIQNVACGNVDIANSTDDTWIGTLELENTFANNIAVYVGTITRRDGATAVNMLNTPVEIVI